MMIKKSNDKGILITCIESAVYMYIYIYIIDLRATYLQAYNTNTLGTLKSARFNRFISRILNPQSINIPNLTTSDPNH